MNKSNLQRSLTQQSILTTPNKMETTWQRVSPETAKAHPLYGIKGWLLVFAISNLLGFLAILGSVRNEAFDAGMSELELLAISHPNVTNLKLTLFFTLTSFAIRCYLLFSKHPQFRKFVSILLFLDWPIAVCMALMTGSVGVVGSLFAVPMVSWVISCAVWITYLQKSRRVRVTFENCIKDNEVQNQQTSVPSQIIPAQPILPSPTVSTNVRPDVVAKTVITPPSLHLQNSSTDSDDYLWEQALYEYDSNTRKQGLYARLFSESEGNETLVKANYLRIRVDEMQQSIALEKERIDTEHKIKIAHEIAISETKLQEQRAYDALPKGVCPNCKKTLLLLSANKCTKCSALFGPHSAFKISEISKQEQLNVLRLLTQNGNSLTEYETVLLNSGSDQHRGLSKRLSSQTNIINS